MFEFLEGFSKRMEFAAVVDSIVNRTNRNQEIEQGFAPQELDNLLFSILVFIMERTLSEDHDCTMESIAGFLSEVLPRYEKQLSAAETDALAKYLVKDILQNKGVKRSYKAMDYSAGFRELPVRLISDQVNDRNQIVYELTRQGYDFLFRTKEVDDKLGFQLEEMRLQMQIDRYYYKEAIGQSAEILRMLVQKRRELAQFEAEVRGDLSLISGHEYERLIHSVDAMLTDEYVTMQKVEEKVRRAREQLEEEENRRGQLDEKANIARMEVQGILNNVRRALSLQRQMIIACESLKKLYLRVLEDAIAYHATKRYNFEDEILRPLTTKVFEDSEGFDRISRGLLAPLFLPQFPSILNLKILYDRQEKIRETESEESVEVEAMVSEQAARARIERRNRAHVSVVRRVLAFAAKHPEGFSLEDFYTSLQSEEGFAELCRERLLFLSMLRLYEIGLIDLRLWKEQRDDRSEDCAGEFDLAYCLGRIGRDQPDYYGIERLEIKKVGPQIEFVLPAMGPERGTSESVRSQEAKRTTESVRTAESVQSPDALQIVESVRLTMDNLFFEVNLL